MDLELHANIYVASAGILVIGGFALLIFKTLTRRH